MELGLVGKPNVGKSTLFSALTLAPAEVANYPFTTLAPNKGVAYVQVPCPHVELGLDGCDPGNAPCRDGRRWVPVEIVDVAGLVPGAHAGKGLGNQFLDDLRQAAVLIHVIDASGGTDLEGTPVAVGTHDPAEDVRFLEIEMDAWILGILRRGWPSWGRSVEAGQAKMEEALQDRLSGLGVTMSQAIRALRTAGVLGTRPSQWTDANLEALARAVRTESKPILVAANKSDVADPAALAQLVEAHDATPVCADAELALRRASEAGLITYEPGAGTLTIGDRVSDKQRKGLAFIEERVLTPHQGTGTQRVLDRAVFETLERIVVFPVEDETHYKDGNGRVLPDALLVPRGCTAREMAYRVHTDLGEGFIRAVDARSKRTVGADHVLEHGDVVRIVART